MTVQALPRVGFALFLILLIHRSDRIACARFRPLLTAVRPRRVWRALIEGIWTKEAGCVGNTRGGDWASYEGALDAGRPVAAAGNQAGLAAVKRAELELVDAAEGHGRDGIVPHRSAARVVGPHAILRVLVYVVGLLRAVEGLKVLQRVSEVVLGV